MFLAVLRFYYDIILQGLLSHYLHGTDVANEEHPFFRRYSETYRKKRDIVKNFWIVSGCLMLIIAQLYAVVALALFTTFLSFSVLDETNNS